LRILELSTEGFVLRQFIVPLVMHLRQAGHEVYPLNGEGLSIRRTISPWDLVAILRLWWRLKRMKIDVLHVQTAKAGAVGRIAAWLAGTPRIVYTMHDVPFHDGLPRWRQRLYRGIERVLATTCQAITVDSPTVKNRVLAARVTTDRHVQVIPVGVDTAWFDPLRFPPRTDGPLVIGTVARLVPEKRIDRVLQCVRPLAGARPLRVLIVGDGPERHRLEQTAWGGVEFVGDQQDVAPWLAQMDLFFLPTAREGLSVAVMEAMSMALPVVVSDLPAFRDLVIYDQTGFAVNAASWVQHLRLLLGSPALRQRLGLAARAHVQQYYEQSVQCRAYERVLCP
jgi:glycosyltransferase involved in cell wall biosynthesis